MISAVQKSELKKLQLYVENEKRLLRLSSLPKYSYQVDERTNKIILCYSIPVLAGIKYNNEKIIRRKPKKRYFSEISLDNWNPSLTDRIEEHYDWVVDQNFKAKRVANSDNDDLLYFIELYCQKIPRRKFRIPSDSTLKADKFFLDDYYHWISENVNEALSIYFHIDNGKKLYMQYINSKLMGEITSRWSNNTANSSYTRIRAFFNWLNFKKHDFPYGLLSNLEVAATSKKVGPSFTDTEFAKVYEFINKYKDDNEWGWFVIILQVMLVTGARVSEVVSMNINDIDFISKTWTFIGKGGQERSVKIDNGIVWSSIHKKCTDKSGTLRKDKDFVFHRRYYKQTSKPDRMDIKDILIEDVKQHFTASGVQHKFKKMVKLLSINPKLSPHSCRRFYITQMLVKYNGNIPLVANLVGHKSWDMVRRYADKMVKDSTKQTLDLDEIKNKEFYEDLKRQRDSLTNIIDLDKL